MKGTPIAEVTHHKHLGVTLQQNSRWSQHITEITSKAKKKVDVLRSFMYKLNRKALKKIYTSFIRPTITMEYASSVWDNCSDQEKE